MSKPPAWFTEAVSTPYEDRFVSVDGVADPSRACRVHYQLYVPGPAVTARPRLVVLVHGDAAHSRWWDWTAPFLLKDSFMVASVDLAGQGDSGRREVYSMDDNVAEVMAVVRDLAPHCQPRPYIVGHSYGGWVAMQCARQCGEELGGIVALDSAVWPLDILLTMPSPPVKKKRGEATQEAMLQRFHLMPPQPVDNQWLMDYLGPLSLKLDPKDTADGPRYMWKDDGKRFVKTRFAGDPAEFTAFMRKLKCRLAHVYGAKSANFADPRVLPYMRAELEEHRPGGELHTPIVAIEDAHHHLMFDQPIAVVTALRSIFGEWQRADARLSTQSKL